MAPRQSPSSAGFTRRDFAEIALGGSSIAFPTATTEEIWDLGAELSLLRVLLIGGASLVVLAALIFGLQHGKDNVPPRSVYLRRLAGTYLATLMLSAALLFGVGRFDLLHEPLTALRRTILVAFPASFAATVVNHLGSSFASSSSSGSPDEAGDSREGIDR